MLQIHKRLVYDSTYRISPAEKIFKIKHASRYANATMAMGKKRVRLSGKNRDKNKNQVIENNHRLDLTV